MSGSPDLPASTIAVPLNHGRHYHRIKKIIPSHLVTASAEMRSALRQTKATVPGWYGAAPRAQKVALKALFDDLAAKQKLMAQSLKDLQSLNDFAQPLLENALNAAGYPLPVNDVFLHVYTPVAGVFGLRSEVVGSRTLSLLQAALHNFEEPETAVNYFAPPSGFITRPDALGRFSSYSTTLTIEAFTALCRQLDLGAQYQAHLELHLTPQSILEQGRLEGRYINQQKAMLKVDAQVALLKGDIDTHAHDLLMRVISGEREIKTGDQQVWYRYPCVMGLLLKGCVVFDLCVEDHYSDAMIVWIPGDPQHPLKKYASFFDFRDELLNKLTPAASTSREAGLTEYQQFLSRFIAQKDRPYYYRRLTELVADAPKGPWGDEWFHDARVQLWTHTLAPLPSWGLSIEHAPDVSSRRVQKQHPSITIEICTMSGDRAWVDVELWEKQFQDMRSRAFANARNMALPTADADATNHASRISHYLNMGFYALNIVSMFVPVLGEVMMAVMAGQLLYETIEGIEEWSSGDTEAAWAHINDVLENMVLLAAGAAVLQGAVAPVIERLKVIKLPDGKQRLWKGDIDEYAHPITLELGSQPDESGLHTQDGQTLLPYDNKNFVLVKDPATAQYRALHPTRPDAYSPEFRHNGQGVWVHEGEDPMTWERSTLLRRLGPSVEGLSDADLESILSISEVHEDVLRRMYVENEPTPILLMESIRQFKAYTQVEAAISQALAGPMSAELCTYAAAFTVDLQGWPAGKAIVVFDLENLEAPVIRYGDAQASGGNIIAISRSQLMNGELAGHVVTALNQQQLEGLLGERLPVARDERLKLFKEHLSTLMRAQTQRLFDSLYEDRLVEGDPARAPIELIQRVFPKLPRSIARRLVAQANKAEVESMARNKVPRRLMQDARNLQRQARLSSAYLGLYREGMVTPDTEALVLNTLENVPGWTDDLRLEVRNDGFEGELRASFGAQGASHRKVLVRVADGKYMALDEQGEQLHGVDDLYRSLQHALPDSHRRSMGLPHTGQGGELKIKVQQHALPRNRLRGLLNMRVETAPFYQPPVRLSDGKLGYPLSGRGALQGAGVFSSYRARLKSLYPNMKLYEIESFFSFYGSEATNNLLARERELGRLLDTLDEWELSPIDGVDVAEPPTPAQQHVVNGRHYVRTMLEWAWRRSGDPHLDQNRVYRGQELSFDQDLENLGPILESLPALPADFNHVSRINIANAGVTDAINGFLSHFPKLRSLELSDNPLTRLPAAVEKMLRLNELLLSRTAITLNLESAAQFRELTRMEYMALDGSPLGLAPDVSRMVKLETLKLEGCGLDRWPAGVFALPRPREFLLDLSENPLTEIPEVAPGSHRAEIIGRTVISQEDVSESVYARYEAYCESVGIDTERHFLPGLEKSSQYWIYGQITEAEIEKLTAIWNRVETEVGSEPLFEIFSDQAENFKKRTLAFRADMTIKVWDMLRAIDESPTLRDRIFLMASAPFTCVDAGAQLFNALGVEVLIYEAYGIPELELRQIKMLKLARGKARLDELGRIARARVAELEALGHKHPEFAEDGTLVRHFNDDGVLMTDIDEVEIYLRYTTELAQRLDLPWQSPSMMFAAPDVTADMIESAFSHVMALEADDGIVTQLLEQPMWVTFLERAFNDSFEAVQAKMDALSDLHTAQEEWAKPGDLSVAQKAALRTQIEKIAVFLKIPASDVAPGKIMSSEDYDARMQGLYETRQTYLQIMTKKALAEESAAL